MSSSKSRKIPIKTADEILKMRASCRAVATILDELDDFLKPGLSTEDIDRFVHQRTISLGGTPSTLNYKGYTKSCCTSVNDVICHGIPSSYEIIKEGDILNVDVSVYMDGFHGDSCRMYFVGGRNACSKDAVELVDITKQALHAGIDQVRPGAHIGDIGAAIQEFIAASGKNYGIVREYTGHGVGREFHELPQVVHIGKRGFGDEMKAGMTFTIEPMINSGSAKTRLSKVDGWTVRTVDGGLSAQWEHTVLVTESGHEILTSSLKEGESQ